MISDTVSFPERLYVEYNRVPYSIYQYVISLVVSLPVSLGVLMNVSVWEHILMWQSLLF